MRTFLIYIFIFFCSNNASAFGHYIYTDNCINVSVEWTKTDSGIETVTLNLKSSVDILLPCTDICFWLDDVTHPYKGVFWNTGCPIIMEFGSDSYWLLKKDSTISYKWEVTDTMFESFIFNVEYISTTTHEYKTKRKKFKQDTQFTYKGKNKIFIKPEDEKILLNRCRLEIFPSR